MSAYFLPIISLCALNKAGVMPPSFLNLLAKANNFLSIALSAYLKSSVLLDNSPNVLPIPPIKPVNKAPSVPNLILLTNLLAGSKSPSSSLCSRVGPPNNSPKVPAC